MNLPTSRNTTYAPNSPVLSADLNGIQDCIIAHKHGPISITLGPSRFAPMSGTTGIFDNVFPPKWKQVFNLCGELWLPKDSRLVSIEWFYDRSVGSFQAIVNDVVYPGLTSSLTDTFTDIVSGAGARSSGVRALGYTAVAKQAFLLEVISNNAANLFHGCQVVVDRI